MNYKITKQYLNGSETTLDTTCKTLDQARTYADQEAEKQAKLNVKITFRIYDDLDVQQYVINSKDIDVQAGFAKESSDSSSGQSHSSSFRPTPLASRPSPKGTMPDYSPDDEK